MINDENCKGLFLKQRSEVSPKKKKTILVKLPSVRPSQIEAGGYVLGE